jgi:hypothetical protein
MKLHKIARNCDIAFDAKKRFCQMKIVFCIARKIDLLQDTTVQFDKPQCNLTVQGFMINQLKTSDQELWALTKTNRLGLGTKTYRCCLACGRDTVHLEKRP